VKYGLKAAAFALWIAVLCLGACTTQTRTTALSTAQSGPWHGRLALRIDGTAAQPQAQSLSAGFELSGNVQSGELTLLSPIGTTLAALNWSAQSASLRAHGEQRNFDSLDELTRQALGTELPVGALFAWLKGEALPVPGWQVNLSAYADGRITAQRNVPLPAAELRLLLD
jgi:outer membrane lipoprotein LolB